VTIIRPNMARFPRLVLGQSPVTNHPRHPKVGGAPVVFSAQTILAAGKATVLNAQTLQSGFRTAYFIDEIRISMITEEYEGGATDIGGALTGLSGLVSILFQTGSFQFSMDAVPVGLCAPLFGQDFGTVNVGDGKTRDYSTVRWMLPKPLFMPAGDVVLANVALADNAILTGYFSAEPCVTITVTYVGRLIPQGYEARSRDIPWLAWWTKNTSESYKESSTRLRNPFLVPAHVQRFTQRTYQQFENADPTIQHYKEESVTGQKAIDNSTAYETIKISDSRGYSIVPRFYPVGDVFDVSRHAWTFGRELTPREQFDMAMTTVGTDAVAGTDHITNVGLVGYRSEAM
jgi:hypothetical protein